MFNCKIVKTCTKLITKKRKKYNNATNNAHSS